jgi:inner membrane protein import complex subunit Tim44-like protein
MNQARHPKLNSLCLIFALCGAMFLLLEFPNDALARVGGGHSYGGGGNHGSGDGAGGAIIWLAFQAVRLLLYLTIEYPVIGIPLDLLVVGSVIYFFSRSKKSKGSWNWTFSYGNAAPLSGDSGLPINEVPDVGRSFELLRRFDPNFSEIVFTDFCYGLYAKAHDARGHGTAGLDLLSPYLSEFARSALIQRNAPGLQEVKGMIVGAMPVVDVRGLETPTVQVSVIFETNYSEVLKLDGNAPTEMTYYVRERWEFERKRDLLSPPPAKATALHCPRCGAPLQKDSVGACAFCGTKIDSGEFQWYVRGIALLSREAKGPLLTSNVPEAGTDYPCVVQPGFENIRAEFERNNPVFSWPDFQARAQLIFNELQAAWSALDWDRARPHETDNIFQMHQYWIEAYKRQGLRNLVDQCAITAMQPVKIKVDAFYNAITLRIQAQGYDYTVDVSGHVVSGSKNSLRRWSEYWTFIRNQQAKSLPARADLNCPNCGGPLKVNVTGICEFCGGKITSGEFDWVLSKIEQDESYAG